MSHTPVRSSRTSAYDQITEAIIALLADGVVPWRRPWICHGPRNLVSGRPYRGINVLILASHGYPSPWWLTYRQALSLGGTVRAGEHGTQVVFWRPIDAHQDHDGHVSRRRTMVVRSYTVFHISQCDLPPAQIPTPAPTGDGIPRCEEIVRQLKTPPRMIIGSDIACYLPSTDTVYVPQMSSFETLEQYYATLFHELGHATGHPTRLNRTGLVTPAPFGSTDYSREELVAEMTSAFVCGSAGVAPEVLPANAEYIAGWLAAVRADHRLLIHAAGQAQRAADYLLGITSSDSTPNASTEVRNMPTIPRPDTMTR